MARKVLQVCLISILSTVLGCQWPGPLEARGSNEAAEPAPEQKPRDASLAPALSTLPPTLSTSPPILNDPKLQAVMMRQIHPGASIVSLEDLSPASRDEFLKMSTDGLPGVVVADFNGDGILDCAALVRFPQRHRVGEWLVVFQGIANGNFKLRLLEKYDSFHDGAYLLSEPPGELKIANAARPQQLRATGITRVHPARRLTVFYWQKGRFQRLLKVVVPSVASRIPSAH
jgi:hypothetical protein